MDHVRRSKALKLRLISRGIRVHAVLGELPNNGILHILSKSDLSNLFPKVGELLDVVEG